MKQVLSAALALMLPALSLATSTPTSAPTYFDDDDDDDDDDFDMMIIVYIIALLIIVPFVIWLIWYIFMLFMCPWKKEEPEKITRPAFTHKHITIAHHDIEVKPLPKEPEEAKESAAPPKKTYPAGSAHGVVVDQGPVADNFYVEQLELRQEGAVLGMVRLSGAHDGPGVLPPECLGNYVDAAGQLTDKTGRVTGSLVEMWRGCTVDRFGHVNTGGDGGESGGGDVESGGKGRSGLDSMAAAGNGSKYLHSTTGFKTVGTIRGEQYAGAQIAVSGSAGAITAADGQSLGSVAALFAGCVIDKAGNIRTADNVIATFPSIAAATEYLHTGPLHMPVGAIHIKDACERSIHSCGGFRWRFKGALGAMDAELSHE